MLQASGATLVTEREMSVDQVTKDLVVHEMCCSNGSANSVVGGGRLFFIVAGTRTSTPRQPGCAGSDQTQDGARRFDGASTAIAREWR